MTAPNDNLAERVTIYLAIESTDLTPPVLTERLGAQPDRQWIIGEPRGSTGKQWECHGWIVETIVNSRDNSGRPVSQLIPIAMERFERRVQPFANAVAGLTSAQKYIVLTVLAQDTPGIEFSKSFLQLVASLGGTLQIDL